ncbi:cytolethal distending toxin subunit A [Campylobacter lari]|nr:cytolethal distending toxin subunit A [Campylobacter lari]EAK0446915.1 cytolethal distending toxin subunit A [Campylobacter lari]
MQKIKFVMILSILIAFFIGCSSKEQFNPLGRSLGAVNDSDPLSIGKNPTPPAKQKAPILVEGEKFPAIPLEPPLIKTNTFKGDNPIKGPLPRLTSKNTFSESSVFENRGFPSDFVTIMNPNGSALTVWALNPGNWIWGYSLDNSKSFGDARVWQVIEFPANYIMLKNAKTNTCLNAYGNGIVHYPCDQSNHAQFWKLLLMSNESFQIQNLATQKCIKTQLYNVMKDFEVDFFNIYLEDCLKPGEKNLDKQWNITTPAFISRFPY